MSPGKRVSSGSQAPLNFQHPYLHNKLARKPQKRELGIIDLFVFKMFGCFTPDDLPPPNPNATVYQAGARSSSSSLTLTSSGTVPPMSGSGRNVPLSPTNSNPQSPPRPASYANAAPTQPQNIDHPRPISDLSHISTHTPPAPAAAPAPHAALPPLATSSAQSSNPGSSSQDDSGSTEQLPHPEAAKRSTSSASSTSSADTQATHRQSQQLEHQEFIKQNPTPSQQQFHHRRRSLRRPDVRGLRRHSSSSAWPEKMPDHISRIAVERTQFVEQRVEERKREAQRRLEEERQRRAAAAVQASSALAESNDTHDEVPFVTPSPADQERTKSVNSSERFYQYEKSNLSENESIKAVDRDPVSSGDTPIQPSSVAGRVSRLSAMFEQQ